MTNRVNLFSIQVIQESNEGQGSYSSAFPCCHSIPPKEGVWTLTSLGANSLSEGIATRQSVPTGSQSVYNSPPPAFDWISMAPECHSVTVAWHLCSAEPVSSFLFTVLWHPFSPSVPRPSQCLPSAKAFSFPSCLFGAMSLKGSYKCPISRWQSFTYTPNLRLQAVSL